LELSVVIPAYNEADRLGLTLERVLGYLDRRRILHEVLVVDDGSRDVTFEIAAAHGEQGVRALRQEANRGKGAALKTGVLASHGELVLLCDADLSTPIEDLERLEARLPETDLVLGSRGAAGADVTVHQPFYREAMGKSFNLIIRALGVRGLRDTQCGFKLLRGDVARELFGELTIERFAFDVELVWLARRRGYRISEVGVRWANSRASKVDPVVDSLRMLRDVLLFRWRHR
jgi:dolichyl-phosphate beta-glucosyltransferase